MRPETRSAIRAARSWVGLRIYRTRVLTPLRARAAAKRVRHTVKDGWTIPSALTTAARAPRTPARRTGKRVLMLTISQIDFDPRINKVARTLAAHGYEVEIMAPALDPDGSEYEVSPGVRYVRVPLGASRVSLVYQTAYREAAGTRAFDYVHANDLTTLTLGWELARTRRVPLVYDAHELWTENVELKGHKWVPMSRRTRFLARHWESLLLRDVDLLVTVGPSIVGEYARRDALKRRPLLLANYPSLDLLQTSEGRSIRAECGFDDSHFVTLYLGGVNPLRNIEAVIAAHAHLPDEHVFVIRGPSVEAFADDYRGQARQLGLEERVFFLPPVGMHEVLAGAAGADCGIVMLRNICKNFYFFYPNKLFEYALAALPIAVSNFPDAAGFVRRERCGVTFDPDSAASIAGALLRLSADRDEARAMGERGRAAILERYNWESAATKLVIAYRRLR